MKIVLDTNLLLVSISRRSETHLIFESLLEGAYELCISTDFYSNTKRLLVAKWVRLCCRSH